MRRKELEIDGEKFLVEHFEYDTYRVSKWGIDDDGEIYDYFPTDYFVEFNELEDNLTDLINRIKTEEKLEKIEIYKTH